MELLNKGNLISSDFVPWAAFHASKQMPSNHQKAIISLMPLFLENAHSVAMIRHALNVVKLATEHVNPGQVPVIAMDQPLFALAKQIQWQWPETYGEEHFVIMFGGLNIEMTVLKALGQWLDCSGWTSVLEIAGIASSGIVNSFVNAGHVTRTRRIHKITAAALYIMQHFAYQKYLRALTEDQQPLQFKEWKEDMSFKHPQFLYWSQVLQLQLIVFQLVRAFRNADFSLYLDSLSQLIPWMFSLDHINYARWLSVHLREMRALQVKHPDVYRHIRQRQFVVHKTKHAFSAIALDHAHEQINASVKGDGGAVGLTENPGALRRWMVAGLEVARMIDEFERSLPPTNGKANAHHDESADLFVLDTKDIVSTEVVDTVKNITHIGERQYDEFVKERLQEKCKAVTEPLTKNKLPLFGTPVQKVTKQTGRLSALKNNCALFSRLYIACKCRDGDLEGFFKHKNQPWPPSLSQMGEMRQGQKADLVKCLESFEEGEPDAPAVDAKIIDGAVLVQMLSPGTATTFQDYAASIFVPYVVNQLQSSKRVDILWDVYQKDSLKKATRQKRGSGLRRRVEASFIGTLFSE